MDNILFMLIVIIIINIYIIFNQHQLLYKNNITPLLPQILSSYKNPINKQQIKKKTICDNPIIIDDIKQYYKKSAVNNNDFNSEISKILKINLVNGDSSDNLYCDVLYTLNNNNSGNRRFAITNNGNVISMGRSNTGLTVQ